MCRAFCTVYYPRQQMHNIYIYINNILFIISTATCFNASVPPSGSINHVLCLVTKLLKLNSIKAVDSNVHWIVAV